MSEEEILKEINQIMEEKVAPNVAMHGGEVKVIDFDTETGIPVLGTLHCKHRHISSRNSSL